MGDWAEDVVQRELNHVLPGQRAVKYGNADRIIAGDPSFPEFYDAYQAELGVTGKRPDLLILPHGVVRPQWNDDVSNLSRDDLSSIAPQARAAIEVRSSKYYAIKYAEARAKEGLKGARQVQSFTPKVEDLRLVKRWIDAYGVPHFYVQVFYDSIYGVSFEDILHVIGKEEFKIERNRNNQEKPTIHIPVTRGIQLARFAEEPTFTAQMHVTRMFRLDSFVAPTGGVAPLDAAVVTRFLGL